MKNNTLWTGALLSLVGLGALMSQSRAEAATTPGAASAFGVSLPTVPPSRTSARGVAFLRQEEGFRPKAYADGRTATGQQLYSIGYGHQIVKGDGLTKDSIITAEHAEQLLRSDLAKFEKVVRDSLPRQGATQGMFDALVSLAYNIGAAGYAGSTVARKMKAGDYAGAHDAFADWTKSRRSGSLTVDPVLVGRRQREQNLFRTA